MKSLNLRNEFLNFFIQKNHEHIPGSSIIPANDNSILFTNAGMNQFKDIFLGLEQSKYKCVTTAQRCIRAGGKHNDLQNVGFTTRHLTCFEMLGNFSFGYYFKELAIEYAWELLTKIYKMNPDLLWVTVYNNDNEAYNIWKNKIGINEKKIIKLGEKDNFWQMGDVGPCGPCSEIYFDRGIKEKVDTNALPGDDDSIRFIEIWNLVFMQYNKDSSGNLNLLENKSIDTGMGLERLSMVINDLDSVFEIDIFAKIIEYIKQNTKIKYEDNPGAFKAISDHIRSASCMIFEGIIPSNEGRGYVLRKILRRALLFSNKLENMNILFEILEAFIFNEDLLFTDLKTQFQFIKSTIIEETEKFSSNLITGSKKFYDMINNNSKEFSGENAFILYDTFGFPLEITEILSKENNLEVNLDEYNHHMNIQRERSKDKDTFKCYSNNLCKTNLITKFIGYDNLNCCAIIIGIIQNNCCLNEIEGNSKCILITNKTVLYPGGGGQIIDQGHIIFKNKEIKILNILKINSAIGIEVFIQDKITINDNIDIYVDKKYRHNISCHHTTAHLFQAAARKKFGLNIKQEGSYVSNNELTFDLSLSKLPSNEELREIEIEVNNNIRKEISIDIKNMTYDEAMKNNAIGLFTEKYDKNNVRVIFIGDVSRELCGGTHLKNTKEIGLFIIKNVYTVSSGTRRFVCCASDAAYNELYSYKDITNNCSIHFKCSKELIENNIEKQFHIISENKKEINELKKNIIDNIITLWKEKNNQNNIFKLNNKYKEFDKYVMGILQKNPSIYIILIEDTKNNIIYLNKHENINYNLENIVNELINQYSFKGKVDKNNIYGIINKEFEKLNL